MVDGVLFVCHANMCRSPMAEFIARRLLADLPVVVTSAGTDAVDGAAMHPYAVEVAAGTGADAAAFRTRRLRPEHLAGAALVLTATRRQRSACTALAPAALTRTFTLRQFARLAAAAEPAGATADTPLRAAVAAAVRARGRMQPAAPGADDLRDPIGGSPADFRRCAEEIERSIRPVLALIATAG
ncbi:low molecular weight phosphatase family protein [Micromonospora sp. WMMA1998]|uniref:Protein-tyrosine phosphatase n=1 Tax=Micromonospora sediminicola TaxID=946078 RepID=A0A1A9BBZ8_9ACTN|nr:MULTISPECIES: low molecular weight phosphatase family protein [Micromonospora]ATO17608.1 low molecular weight phosphatase family protein [Micromonospora sp. WMMA2032]PGH46459.1 low molecular weight phosphatase family protein [Micromonospora sp. WMMA1996]WBC17972.1 low molecular weight phosphatase family protein [Micromonospora sp. WMMA1998]SBT66417.1 protein-tyrosine phosphatase [Micromonospora sediminicola]